MHTQSVKLKHNGTWRWGIYGLDEMGHLWLKWMGHLWEISYCFLGDMLKKKNTGPFSRVPFPVLALPQHKSGYIECIKIYSFLESGHLLA